MDKIQEYKNRLVQLEAENQEYQRQLIVLEEQQKQYHEKIMQAFKTTDTQELQKIADAYENDILVLEQQLSDLYQDK
jgi:uncharacterized coiled-coil DUF342 family protein